MGFQYKIYVCNLDVCAVNFAFCILNVQPALTYNVDFLFDSEIRRALERITIIPNFDRDKCICKTVLPSCAWNSTTPQKFERRRSNPAKCGVSRATSLEPDAFHNQVSRAVILGTSRGIYRSLRYAVMRNFVRYQICDLDHLWAKG
jgi:hypothetical protein